MTGLPPRLLFGVAYFREFWPAHTVPTGTAPTGAECTSSTTGAGSPCGWSRRWRCPTFWWEGNLRRARHAKRTPNSKRPR